MPSWTRSTAIRTSSPAAGIRNGCDSGAWQLGLRRTRRREGAQHLQVLSTDVLERVPNANWKKDDRARPELANGLVLDPEPSLARQEIDRLFMRMGVQRRAPGRNHPGELRHPLAANGGADEHSKAALTHQCRRNLALVYPSRLDLPFITCC